MDIVEQVGNALSETADSTFAQDSDAVQSVFWPELKKLGWKCVRDGGDSYWSFRVYEYR